MRLLKFSLVGILAIPVGCTITPPDNPAAVLAGTWNITPADPGDFEDVAFKAVFDESGNLVELSGEREDGATVSRETSDAEVTVEGNAVTISLPGETSGSVFEGELSEDGNTLTGSFTRSVELGDLDITLPGGELTLDKQDGTDPCLGVECADGESCVDGECVAGDPCDGVECADGESCVDGECVASDPCDGVECGEGESCVDGECVAADPCDGVECGEGESCVDGECVAADPCADVECASCETCVDGTCQAAEGDATAGEAFYTDNGCATCHGPNANDGFAPSLVGAECAALLEVIDGTESHTGGTVDGVTDQDAADLAAWLGSL